MPCHRFDDGAFGLGSRFHGSAQRDERFGVAFVARAWLVVLEASGEPRAPQHASRSVRCAGEAFDDERF